VQGEFEDAMKAIRANIHKEITARKEKM